MWLIWFSCLHSRGYQGTSLNPDQCFLLRSGHALKYFQCSNVFSQSVSTHILNICFYLLAWKPNELSTTVKWGLKCKACLKYTDINQQITELGSKEDGNWPKRRTVEVRRKQKEGITDTWVSVISSSSLLSLVHAWPAGVSCHPGGVHSSVYTLASDPPPQTFPWYSRDEGQMTWGAKEGEEKEMWESKRRQGKEKRNSTNTWKEKMEG